ncbi:hypothetical protein CWC31_15575 [Pseudoalteromonas ruthenica]|uniref:DUF4844 domain-containing protein n=1 Tax=Pseudoalteromonas ruthenica TaxID=151081 RepID=UPI001108ABD0|nr:DUF4844 domain-containing protein [Pseudoalteromonas ruthenica]TLX49685.1 hypothetical protein CWC31_15575 [Pseudoalteromonas ruthenica]
MNDVYVSRLEKLRASDLFGPDGFLYSGVQDPKQKAELSKHFDNVISEFIKLAVAGASKQDYLQLLQLSMQDFDRDALDTEDAENIASNFEKIMDCIELDSSYGALNDWMYGF